MDTDQPRRQGLPVWLLLLLVSFGAIVGFSCSEGDYIAASTIGVATIFGMCGYFLGALRIFGALGAIVAAYYLAPATATWLAPHLQGAFDNSPGVTRLLSLGCASLVIMFSITLLAKSISRWLTESRPRLRAGNQLLGFGVGAAEGTLGMLVLLSGIVTAAPLANERLQHPADNDAHLLARRMANHIVEMAALTQRSKLGPLIANYNPFKNSPQLQRVERTLAAVKDPQVLATISDHPAMAKLQEKPSVRAALHSIANDPQLRELAMSGKAMDSQTAMALLNNPTIAKLLEQPELIQDITQALGEVDSGVWNSLTEPETPRERFRGP